MKCLLVLLSCAVAVLLMAPREARCCPATSEVITLHQPDGTTLLGHVRGDEWFHWYETLDGKQLVQDAGGVWRLGPPVEPSAIRPQKPRPTVHARAVPPTGTGKVPVICIAFPDMDYRFVTAQFNSVLFRTFGSTMTTYYTEVSYGKFTVSGVVLGWYYAANDHDWYGRDTNPSDPGSDAHPGQLVFEAVHAADKAGFDFKPYDTDGDGYVDLVAVVHAGTDQANGGPTTDIWSQTSTLNDCQKRGDGGGAYTTKSGVKVNAFTVQAEHLSTGHIATVGVFCHEYGHALGLPDLYDTNYHSNGVGDWSLMGHGSWNQTAALGGVTGDCPAHLDAWCKQKLGWITPKVQSATVLGTSIPATETTAFAYKVYPTATAGKEYFLIENRQKTGFDAGLPGAGLCIYHVDDALMTSMAPNNNPWYPGHTASGHYGVAVEQADGLFSLEKNLNYGEAADLYASSAKGIGDDTTPNTRPYAAQTTQALFAVRTVGASAASMTANIVYYPSISGLVPTAARPGHAAFTLTVNGKQFYSKSVVQWNGSARTTTYVSTTQLKAQITAADVHAAGTAKVTVANASDVVSKPSTFTISPTAPAFAPARLASVTSASVSPSPRGAQVTFALSAQANVTVTVMNLAGRPVRALASDRTSPAGVNALAWDGLSDRGLKVPGGTYLVTIAARSEDGSVSRTVRLLRLVR